MEWVDVSLPTPLVDEIREVIKKVPYWSSVADFTRDAVREKLEKTNCETTKETSQTQRRNMQQQ